MLCPECVCVCAVRSFTFEFTNIDKYGSECVQGFSPIFSLRFESLNLNFFIKWLEPTINYENFLTCLPNISVNISVNSLSP